VRGFRMEGRTPPAAASAVGLAAASRKLREAVGAAVTLPAEAQDQVADAMQAVLQQLLLSSRCGMDGHSSVPEMCWAALGCGRAWRLILRGAHGWLPAC
jgi:hypothetical protein